MSVNSSTLYGVGTGRWTEDGARWTLTNIIGRIAACFAGGEDACAGLLVDHARCDTGGCALWLIRRDIVGCIRDGVRTLEPVVSDTPFDTRSRLTSASRTISPKTASNVPFRAFSSAAASVSDMTSSYPGKRFSTSLPHAISGARPSARNISASWVRKRPLTIFPPVPSNSEWLTTITSPYSR